MPPIRYVSLLALAITFMSTSPLNAQNVELGLASYYSDDFHGRSTAYGDVYNKNELTCAHKRYPYGTMLRVTNMTNNKTVRVKVIDKGPFIKGRVVDLSRRAAELLGFFGEGTAQVKVEPVNGATSAPSIAENEPAPAPPPPAPPVEENTPTSFEVPTPDPRLSTQQEETTAPEEEGNTAAAVEEDRNNTAPNTVETTTTAANTRFRKVGDDYSPYGVYRITLEKPTAGNYGVQVASFSTYDGVLQRVAELQAKWFENVLVSTERGEDGNKLYKVILGPFDTEKNAQYYQQSLAKRYKIRGFVTTLSIP